MSTEGSKDLTFFNGMPVEWDPPLPKNTLTLLPSKKWLEGYQYQIQDLLGNKIDILPMKKMPKQKPHRSEQVVCTPDDFLAAVKKRLGITQFTWDLAATKENSVCGADYCYTEKDNALVQPWNLTRHFTEREPNGEHGELVRYVAETQWNWCNPPFTKIGDWVHKAAVESNYGACTAMLVPASVGANWWADWVNKYAYVTFLNGRLTFKGHDKPYPKDMALLLYAPFLQGGSCVWRWK